MVYYCRCWVFIISCDSIKSHVLPCSNLVFNSFLVILPCVPFYALVTKYTPFYVFSLLLGIISFLLISYKPEVHFFPPFSTWRPGGANLGIVFFFHAFMVIPLYTKIEIKFHHRYKPVKLSYNSKTIDRNAC